MTDKKIIIDGVDVEDCIYYEQKNDTGEWCDLTCTRENAPAFRCERMPNCYYKKLKRLEAENEQLKTECDMYKTFYRAKHDDIEGKLLKYYKQFKQLEVENAKLKEESEKYRIEAYKQGQYGNKQFDKYYRCYQTLQEINEIAEVRIAECLTCSERYTEDCFKDIDKEGDCTHCAVGSVAHFANVILHKINESEE